MNLILKILPAIIMLTIISPIIFIKEIKGIELN
jgi:hypothetical protein